MEARLVDLLGPVLLAHADHGHFHEAALVGAAEGRVGLDPAAEHDTVCLKGVFIHKHRLAVGPFPHLHRLHGGENGAAHIFFRHAVGFDDFPLSFGRGAPVAAHGRKYKGIRPLFL